MLPQYIVIRSLCLQFCALKCWGPRQWEFSGISFRDSQHTQSSLNVRAVTEEPKSYGGLCKEAVEVVIRR